MRYDDDTIANVLEGTAAKAQAKATAASARALSSLGSSAARCCKGQLALHHSTGTRSMVKEGCCNALVGLRKSTQLLFGHSGFQAEEPDDQVGYAVNNRSL